MPDPTDLDLDAIEARCAAVGAGPWEHTEPSNWLGLASLVRNDKAEPIAHISLSGWGKRKGRAIGAFIAASRTDVELLCREVRALRQRVAELEGTP